MELTEIGIRIKALMKLKSVKRCYLAKELGISYNTLTKKLNGQREFTIVEILKMQEIFKIESSVFGNIIFNDNLL